MDVHVTAPDTLQAGHSYTFTVEAGEATQAYNRAEFDRLFDTWSTILAKGLEALKEASPIQRSNGEG